MSNSKSVIISFGQGDFQTGFPQVGIEVLEAGIQRMKSRASLPPAPNLPDLYRRWQIFHEDYYQGLSWRSSVHFDEDDIEINEDDITNVSEVGFTEIGDLLRQQLNDWLDFKEFRDVINRKVRTCLGSEEIQVRIETEDEQLRRLPWCLWYFFEDYQKAEPELSSPIYTRLQPISYQAEVGEKLVKVLAIIGNSEGIDVNPDRRTIKQLPGGEVTFLTRPNLEDLNDKLWEEGWDILFFAGHSSSKDGTGRIYINDKDSLTIEELKPALNKAIALGLQLAIFNSCDGLKLASDLADLQIPAITVMKEPVPDLVAQKWLEYFLKGFSSGESLHYSIRQARERLQRKKLPCADWLPTLCRNPATEPPTWRKMRTGGRIGGDRWVEIRPKHQPRSLPVKKALSQIVSISLAVTLLVMGVRYTGILEPIELLAYDRLMSQRPREETIDSHITVIEINQQEILKYDPVFLDTETIALKDSKVAELIRKLQPYNPKFIGLNMQLGTPRGEGNKERQALISEFRNSRIIFSQCSFKSSNENQHPPPELSKEQVQTQLGFSDLENDNKHKKDDKPSVVRRYLLDYNPSLKADSSPCNTPKSFGLQLASKYLDLNNKTLHLNKKGEWYYKDIVFKKLTVPYGGYQTHIALDGQSSQILINYRPPWGGEMTKHLTITQVLEGKINTEDIEDRVVLIGYGAPPAKKIFQTPYGEMSSLWIQSHVVSQLINAVLEDRPLIWVLPQWGKIQWGDVLFVWIWAFSSGIIAWGLQIATLRQRSRLMLTLIFCTVIIWILYGICLNIIAVGGWMPLVPTAITMLITTILATNLTIKSRSRSKLVVF